MRLPHIVVADGVGEQFLGCTREASRLLGAALLGQLSALTACGGRSLYPNGGGLYRNAGRAPEYLHKILFIKLAVPAYSTIFEIGRAYCTGIIHSAEMPILAPKPGRTQCAPNCLLYRASMAP